jgi:hypothetical protein
MLKVSIMAARPQPLVSGNSPRTQNVRHLPGTHNPVLEHWHEHEVRHPALAVQE